MNIDFKELIKDLKNADPNMSKEELFEHCIRIGNHNEISTEKIIKEVKEILK